MEDTLPNRHFSSSTYAEEPFLFLQTGDSLLDEGIVWFRCNVLLRKLGVNIPVLMENTLDLVIQ